MRVSSRGDDNDRTSLKRQLAKQSGVDRDPAPRSAPQTLAGDAPRAFRRRCVSVPASGWTLSNGQATSTM
jgi:hypothetical protein